MHTPARLHNVLHSSSYSHIIYFAEVGLGTRLALLGVQAMKLQPCGNMADGVLGTVVVRTSYDAEY